MKYRKASIDDIVQLMDLRKRQLLDEGIEPTIDIDMELREFFRHKLSDGSLIQWLVEDEQNIVACGAIVFYDFPPSYTNRSGKKGYICNMYKNENYRGQGIATQLLDKLVEEAKQLGVTRIWLGASKMGKPVYKKFGFIESNEWLELNM
ncbi:GNAT family N-acetyltransferase [Robertmurraya yapensis]|uniref:GNAT family N-acetyltransferase n=2 Tax=Bacillaceae TaxID=186817 RepID=A0A3S0IMJ9_9BACI|nr:GNAT family N-acetyltransferase [Bacillus yapensis]RTR35791.1 GNAT family N-acetyltransferase [Bacillus yapensis]TKS98593.1 GNAT family N-acetyltransferase [Bacillus yapensis]